MITTLTHCMARPCSLHIHQCSTVTILTHAPVTFHTDMINHNKSHCLFDVVCINKCVISDFCN